MRVKWLRKALVNIESAAAYIARDDPSAACRIVQRILDQVDSLAQNPAMGRPGRIPGTRELVVTGTPHIVTYRVNAGDETMEILRVLHASRRVPLRW